MNPGLDYLNSQKDPNFFQCQLVVVYSLAILTVESSDNESYVAKITYFPKSV
jgi:hypothetical protein